jgi:hypothetical protein
MFTHDLVGLIGSGLIIAAAGVAAQSGGTKPTHPGATAKGTFDVSSTPIASAGASAADGVALQLGLDKRFQGDLAGTSKGQMMAAYGGIEGSGAYVAIERFTGTLGGRAGSFMLQHSGWMSNAGGMDALITVVPDSGTGQLTGLSGTFKIRIVGKDHFYQFDYTLPARDQQ